MRALATAALGLAFAANLAFLSRELWSSWRGLNRRWAALAAALIAALCIAAATRGVELRGGYDNDHDFNLLSMDVFTVEDLPNKEASPLVAFALFRLLGGTLDALLLGQMALWLLCGLLLFGVLRRAGVGTSISAVAAGAFSLNWLAVLNTYSFSTTNANLFHVLSALSAFGAFVAHPRPSAAAWLAAAAFLTSAGRVEFALPLGLGSALWLARGGGRELAGLPRGQRAFIGGLVFAFAGAAAACFRAMPSARSTGAPERLWDFSENLRQHLGELNLSQLFPLPAEAVPILAVALGVLALTSRARRLWALMAVGWLSFFAGIYALPDLYPLHFMRHQLYMLLPFVVLAALAVQAGADLLPRLAPKRPGPWAAALLCSYFVLNLQRAAATQGELRTNDLEWQFLHGMSRRWPGCAVYTQKESRRELLRRFFPATERCMLLYRSAADQVLAPLSEEALEAAVGPPLAERVFTHRFYTAWHGPFHGGNQEITEPVPVRIGFFEPPVGRRAAWVATLENERGLRAFSLGRLGEALERFDAAALADPAKADVHLNRGVVLDRLGAVDAALEAYARAGDLSRGTLCADAHASRATLLDRLGRRNEARRDAERAIRCSPKDWARRRDVERILAAVPIPY